MAWPPQDRFIRKEVALGTIRELEPPKSHIGTRLLAPMMDVEADDVIFDYATGLTDGLAPARAEDAESELAQKDDTFLGQGRASVLDWALKDHYVASDVTRWQQTQQLRARLGVNAAAEFPLVVGSASQQLDAQIARDDALRRRKLDNRLEWLIMTAMETGGIAYNDGRITFTIDYGRPADQQDEAPPSTFTWNLTTSDPIGDIQSIQQFMFDRYGVRMGRAICSQKVLNSIMNSTRFIALSGFVGAAGSAPVDPRYLMSGWGPSAAQEVVEAQTGLKFIPYDSVYQTRAIGSNTKVNNRFLNEKKIIFLPDEADIEAIDDGMIGFGKTLTSPHPEGNWQSGFYEWELEDHDPWGRDRGTGIKAFPVFPHMEYTYTMVALP